MNQTAGGAPYTGVAFGGGSAGALEPLKIESETIQAQAAPNASANIVQQLNEDQNCKLRDYLLGRLDMGSTQRNKRLWRFARIDRSISTWQTLDKTDSERERIEDNTGKQMALPMNLPVLASHLNDMASYFTETLAPISNPFFTSSGDDQTPAIIQKLNRDATIRNYYGELNLTIRSLLKYNIGGFEVIWDTGSGIEGQWVTTQPGNYWKHLDMYNTMWDPAVRNPADVATKGEWAATVTLANRLELMRRSLSGEWVGLDKVLASGVDGRTNAKYYREPQVSANLTDQGQDARTAPGNNTNNVNWDAWGLGLASDIGPEVDGFEVVNMYCWLVPAQFGLLTDAERKELEAGGQNPDSYLELWRFKLVDCELADAKPALNRQAAVGGEVQQIPVYLSYLSQDQLREAQRSFMELMKGFQRFASAMYNIYVAGMRKNVWGVKGIDPQMFDPTKLKTGDTVGVLESKQPGRDVRTGLMTLDSTAGVENALQAVDGALNLKNSFFPSQALPNQVAGIDRAVKSQVTMVVQGAQRGLRLLVRVLDSSLMLPTRTAAYRNLKRFDKDGIQDVTDEAFAKMIGSGIESMESERVADALQNLLYAVIQNQEAMQVFDVPKMMTYLSRVLNLSVDLGMFARQPAPQPVAAPPAPTPAA